LSQRLAIGECVPRTSGLGD